MDLPETKSKKNFAQTGAWERGIRLVFFFFWQTEFMAVFNQLVELFYSNTFSFYRLADMIDLHAALIASVLARPNPFNKPPMLHGSGDVRLVV